MHASVPGVLTARHICFSHTPTSLTWQPCRGEGACLDGCVGRLVHGGHARAVELPREALNMGLQGHWPHAGLEIEQSLHDARLSALM